MGFPQRDVPVLRVLRVQENGLSVYPVPLQGVAFALHIGDDDVPVLRFLLLPNQYQVPVVDAGAGHAVAPGMERDQLMPSIEVEDQVKAPNDDILYIIQDIKVAILNDEKISFRYYEYDPELKQVPKHNGYVYVVSPYAMIWKKDRYYLVGWSEKHRDVAHFRIDRIGKLSLTGKARHPAPEDLHLGDRSSKVFSMFDGPEEVVTLRLRPRLIGQVIDQFGEKLEISKKRENRMDVTVTVHLSPTFYAWLFQYTGEMTVIAPEHVREAYAGYLQEALDDALGE